MMNSQTKAFWTSLRFSMALPVVITGAYALNRWFFLGLNASKWIGLPQYESAMRGLQNESRHWGIAAILLEFVAVILLLPPTPDQRISQPATEGVPVHSLDHHEWIEYLGRCVLRVALCCAVTIALALVYAFLASAGDSLIAI